MANSKITEAQFLQVVAKNMEKRKRVPHDPDNESYLCLGVYCSICPYDKECDQVVKPALFASKILSNHINKQRMKIWQDLT